MIIMCHTFSCIYTNWDPQKESIFHIKIYIIQTKSSALYAIRANGNKKFMAADWNPLDLL